MIIRILGDTQYDVPDERIDQLNALDDHVQAALDADDSAGFAPALRELLAAVRSLGSPLADSELTTSDLVLPAEDSELAQVRALLGDEGLIPG